jgi:NTP pyrophosphatase (non-canonical NTP hydrolase)
MTETAQKPIRLTITVTPEVHAAFDRLATASGMSMSKCMGEWLGDTLDAVEYTANMVEKARQAPKMVMRELHAYTLGLADETGELLRKMKKRGSGDGGGRPKGDANGAGAPVPPSCNTGGKVPPSPGRDDSSHAAAPRAKRATRSKQ